MSNSNHKAVSDEELIAKCLSGSEQFCKILFERFYGKMLNVCRRYAKDPNEAKDMVQEGFIRVFKSLGQFNHKGSLEGWIRRVMVSSSINYIRKYYKRDMFELMDNDTFNAEDPAQNIYGKLDAEGLLRIIQKLTPAYRMVFNLYAIEGYSHQEIASMLEISESTSRSNLVKARQKLQDYLQKDVIKEKVI